MSKKEKSDNFFTKPPVWAVILLLLCTAVFCTLSILAVTLWANVLPAPIAYIFYGLAGVTLAYTVYLTVRFAPHAKTWSIESIKRNPLGKKLLEHYGFRTVLFSGFSLIFNTAYVLFYTVVAIFSRSVWYGALAGYYTVLMIMRASVVFYHIRELSDRKKGTFVDEQKELRDWKRYRLCGILLVFLPFFLSVAIAQMVIKGTAFTHYGWTIYAFALYAFYKIITAVINLVKAHKTDSATVQALRNISFADALTSILALQTSLLRTFSNGNNAIPNALTGAGVSLLTLALGIWMLIRAHKNIKNKGTNNGK